MQGHSSKNTDVHVSYQITALGNSHGLNSSDISALFQDQDGFIWVGTPSGISRFNGSEFENFTKIGTAFLGRIHSIAQDSSGTLWAAGVNGLYFYRNGAFHPTSIRDKEIRVVHRGEGKLWVGGYGFIPFALSTSDLLKLKRDEAIEPKPIVDSAVWAENIERLLVRDIDTDEQGKVWMALYNTRAYFYGKQLKVYGKDNPSAHKYSVVKAINQDSVFWGSEDTGLMLHTKNKLEQLTHSATYIFADTDYSSYFLTTEKLLQLKDGQLQTLHTFSTYKNLYFKKLIVDREGNFWIGAEGNLLKLTPCYFRTWSIFEESLLHSNHSVAQLLDGQILIGSSKKDILTLKSDTFVSYTHIPASYNSLTGDIYPDKNGWVWYATSMDGLIVDRNGKKEQYTVKDGLGDKGQYLFYKNCKGQLWSGGENGITHVIIGNNDKVSFKNFMVAPGHSEVPLFRSMFESPDKTMWAAGNKGLFVLSQGKLTQWSFPEPTTPWPIVTACAMDSTGQLWISTQGEGLWQCRFNAKHEPELIRQWGVKDGLSTDVILDIHIDRMGRLWVAGQNSICALTLAYGAPSILCYDKIDGWFNEPTPHCRLMESDNGYLWAVGLTEICAFPLYSLPQNKVKPNTFISQIQLFDGKEDVHQYSQHASGNTELPKELVLPHDKNFLSFHFATTSYTKPDKNRFKYKLIGLDLEWSNPTSQKKVDYPGLQPGSYTFTVLAANNDGTYGDNPASFSFVILAPWYKTWWAYLIYVLLAIASADRFYRFQLSKRMAWAESRRLKEINQVKNNLYTNITHEFRTPLTVILGMANTLKSDIQNNQTDHAGQSLEMIERNSKNLLRLVNEMLDLAKIESGNVQLRLVQSDVVPFVKYICESFYLYAQEAEVNLMVYAEVDQLFMDFDIDKLAIIISNVLSNAVKFTPSGGKIIVHLNKIQKKKKELLVLKIKDTGIGISRENIPRIFDRFYQAGNALSHKSGGTGIGLALTKELVELMDGAIGVQSAQGKGSEFRIEIPITTNAAVAKEIQLPTVPDDSNSPEALPVKNFEDADMELPSALIIEDNMDVVYYLRTCLNGKYRTYHAPNGQMGIDYALENIPDIIICDVMMPGKSGFEVCKTLKADERTDHIPIIMLTAKVSMKDRLTGLSHGADAYLTKPFNTVELFTRLDQLVTLRKKIRLKFENGNFGHFLKTPAESPETKFLQKAIKLIHEHLDDAAFGSVSLAHELHLSESQIYRKLKAITGKSTAVFIRSVRLQHSKELIQTTEKSISEIAYEVGFNDPSYFSRAFKEEFGFAPSAMPK